MGNFISLILNFFRPTKRSKKSEPEEEETPKQYSW
jgi:hypothetical protein